MRIGVTLPFGAPDGPGRLPTWREMHAFAAHAEAIGLDFALGCDHFLSGPAGRPAEAIHEGWTIVAALAASNSTIELGQLVTCVSFRSPALLAKMAVTADGVIGGRLVLGLGAGWYDPEYLAFGFPADHRVARFEEALQIIGPLLRGERLTFAGRYHQIRDAVLLSRPARQTISAWHTRTSAAERAADGRGTPGRATVRSLHGDHHDSRMMPCAS